MLVKKLGHQALTFQAVKLKFGAHARYFKLPYGIIAWVDLAVRWEFRTINHSVKSGGYENKFWLQRFSGVFLVMICAPINRSSIVSAFLDNCQFFSRTINLLSRPGESGLKFLTYSFLQLTAVQEQMQSKGGYERALPVNYVLKVRDVERWPTFRKFRALAQNTPYPKCSMDTQENWNCGDTLKHVDFIWFQFWKIVALEFDYLIVNQLIFSLISSREKEYTILCGA